MLRSNIILSGLFLGMLAGPRAAMAAEIQNIKPNSAVAGEDAPACYNKFGIKGATRASSIRSRAFPP